MRYEDRNKVYYEGTDQAHDDLLRCDGCKKLVAFKDLARTGGCPKCGNRKVVEIRVLTTWEWFKIWSGLLRFPNSRKFIKEFSTRTVGDNE